MHVLTVCTLRHQPVPLQDNTSFMKTQIQKKHFGHKKTRTFSNTLTICSNGITTVVLNKGVGREKKKKRVRYISTPQVYMERLQHSISHKDTEPHNTDNPVKPKINHFYPKLYIFVHNCEQNCHFSKNATVSLVSWLYGCFQRELTII